HGKKYKLSNTFIETPIFERLSHRKNPLEFENSQRAHSPLLAAGLASESKKDKKSLRSKIPRSLLRGASILIIKQSCPSLDQTPGPDLASKDWV
ncbi:MAG: hypothetical protein ABIG42_06120, partial [bacterium]